MSRVSPVGVARLLRLSVVLAACVVAASGLSITAQQPPDFFRQVVFREVGPTRQGGRFVEFAVVEATPRIFYAATASGGLWKTENNGMTFVPVFDTQPVVSIGAVAVSQSSPNVVYVGTGEGNNSRSAYWGDGVYVSTNAGQSWTNTGLRDSHHIGRIVVHPTDPNTAYVSALGRLYSANEERGLYKTIDGGKTWTKSLAVKAEGKDIGVVDVAMDPKNPLVLYAATYDKVRLPWSFAEGGPGSAIHKTTDAGKTWAKLAGGLPTGMLGRIGLSIFRQDPNVVYAVIENANSSTMPAAERQKRLAQGFGDGSIGDQLFRTDDAGKTWRQVAGPVEAPPVAPAAGEAGAPPAQAGRGAPPAGRGAPPLPPAGGGRGGGGFGGGSPPYYYGQVRVDPNDKDHVYVMSAGSQETRDGGKTWTGAGLGGDSHALWINPKDSLHMLNGYDHGMTITFDGGRSWYHPDNLPLAQFYAVGIDMDVPYNVYGGLQDNGSKKGPSTRRGGGNIPFEDWTGVGGGDGMYNVVSWADSRWLYNESQFGVIQRVDQRTGQSQSIQANRPARPADDPYRWNWNAPILVSPHNPDVIFHAAQVVLRSPFRGNTWEAISPDLTVNDKSKRAVPGPCTTCGSGNITYATITALDESPIVPGLLWVGTDDGNVQVTRDGGQTWTNVRDRITGHPGYWVSRVVASHAAAGTAYVTVTGLRNDDFKPFIWKTTDFGQTWTSIAGNLPQEAVNVVRESPRNANVLFVGTDLGAYATINGGQSWTKMRGTAVQVAGGGRGGGGGAGGPGAGRPRGLLPTQPVYDMKIHPRDRELVLATHGRGIFIADISEIEELNPAVLAADAHLFEIDPVIDWVAGQRTETSSVNFGGMSRPTDMGISYYLRSDVTGDLKVRVYNGSRLIAEMDGPKTAGINTVRWNLEARRERVQGEPVPAGGRGGRGGGGGAAQPAGGGFVSTPVEPGQYRVILSVGGRDYTQTGVVMADPNGK
ncbi:MAG TPA: hypothetical protein VES67_26510 [Vicinamibacterales bacterium]|nr:hypothetical protein [Vicinamibacterales bacterium]